MASNGNSSTFERIDSFDESRDLEREQRKAARDYRWNHFIRFTTNRRAWRVVELAESQHDYDGRVFQIDSFKFDGASGQYRQNNSYPYVLMGESGVILARKVTRRIDHSGESLTEFAPLTQGNGGESVNLRNVMNDVMRRAGELAVKHATNGKFHYDECERVVMADADNDLWLTLDESITMPA